MLVNSATAAPLLAQFGGGGTAQPVGVHPAWLVLPIVIALAAVMLCVWLGLRMKSLIKAIRRLEAGDKQERVLPAGFGFSPRFKLRTLILLLTVAAVLVGMFAAELNRARRQGEVVEQLRAFNSFGDYDSAHYRLGWLGNSRTAGVICDWVHPHFGCRLTHLTINLMDASELMTDGTVHSTKVDIASLRALRYLESLQMRSGELSAPEFEAIASLPRLQHLSLHGCHLPPHAMDMLSGSKSLETLEVSSCHLMDADLAEFDAPPTLRSINLSNNRLTDECVAAVVRYRQLATLLLYQNTITDEAIPELLEMKHLERLGLAFTDVTTDGAKQLATAKSLREVSLGGTKASLRRELRDEVEAAFKNNPRVEVVWEVPGDDTGQAWDFQDNRPSAAVGPSRGFGSGSGVFRVGELLLHIDP